MALCEWQQNETCSRLAYSTQHMTNEDKNQSLKEVWVGTRWFWVLLQQRESFSLCRKSMAIKYHQRRITKINGRVLNYVVGVTNILYPICGVIINILWNEDNSTTMSQLPTSPNAHAWIHQNVPTCFEKVREMGALQTHILCVHISMQWWIMTMTSSCTLQRIRTRNHATT